MRERKRKHDDLHRPMGGKGKRAFSTKKVSGPTCPDCGAAWWPHLCVGSVEDHLAGRSRIAEKPT